MDIAKEISVVIQGPIDDRTYEAIDHYQYFKEVIVSTWEDEDFSLLAPATGAYSIVKSKYPDDMSKVNNQGSRYFMSFTTLAGSYLAKGKYVMKTRSDELYPDLTSMLKNLEKYPDRMQTTDNGFWKKLKGAVSNHLFIEQKKYLDEAMLRHVAFCHDSKSELNSILNYPEQSFGFFIAKSRAGTKVSSKEVWENINSLYKKNIFVTPCRDLPGHLHSGASAVGRGFKRSSLPYPLGRIDMHSGVHDINGLCQHIEDLP